MTDNEVAERHRDVPARRGQLADHGQHRRPRRSSRFFLGRMQASTIADNTVTDSTHRACSRSTSAALTIDDNNDHRARSSAALVVGVEPTEEREVARRRRGRTDERVGAVREDVHHPVGEDRPRLGATRPADFVEVDQSVIYSTPVNAALNTWTGNDDLRQRARSPARRGRRCQPDRRDARPAPPTRSPTTGVAGLLLAGDPGPQEVTIRGNVISGNGTGSDGRGPRRGAGPRAHRRRHHPAVPRLTQGHTERHRRRRRRPERAAEPPAASPSVALRRLRR